MALFKIGKKEEESKKTCCCGSVPTPAAESGSGIKVLGSGCAKCNELEANTKAALAELGMDTAVDHVRDFSQIAAYGVMSTPALVADGKVLSAGRVLKKDEIVKLLRELRG